MLTMIEPTTIDGDVSVATRTGLVAGTIVLTMKGEAKVEDLKAGDRIISRDAGMVVLKGVTKAEATMSPIRIKSGSLGHNRPETDMLISPEALIHIRDWRAQALFGKSPALVPARRLIDGEYISAAEEVAVTTINLEFDRQHIIYADGIEVATNAV